jgi:hypothetical protein
MLCNIRRLWLVPTVRFLVSVGFRFSPCKLFPRARLRRNIRGFGNQPETGNPFAAVPDAGKLFLGGIFNRALWGICKLHYTAFASLHLFFLIESPCQGQRAQAA